jgi:hypothetical protein
MPSQCCATRFDAILFLVARSPLLQHAYHVKKIGTPFELTVKVNLSGWHEAVYGRNTVLDTKAKKGSRLARIAVVRIMCVSNERETVE